LKVLPSAGNVLKSILLPSMRDPAMRSLKFEVSQLVLATFKNENSNHQLNFKDA